MIRTVINATDMFCGAGGTTNGVVEAGVEVKYAINHWDVAIQTHQHNHPQTEHLLNNIDEIGPEECEPTTFLTGGPSCTSHSLAKGAKRKKKLKMTPLPGMLDEEKPLAPEAEVRSRCTMNDPQKWAAKHNYPFIVLENVVDVIYWQDGDYDNYQAWLKRWTTLGYEYKVCYYNSMHFPPTPQSRDRWYFVAWKKGIRPPDLNYRPDAYCTRCEKRVQALQTWKAHVKEPWGRYGKNGQYVYCCEYCMREVTPYYYCAANAIEWSIPGQRIGDRRQPLEPKTMERIQYGLEKFSCAPFATQLNKTTLRATSLFEGVFPTQTTDNGQYIVNPRIPFLLNLSHAGNSPSYVYSLDQPMGTQTTRQEIGITFPPAFTFGMNHAPNLTEMWQPLDTQTTYDDQAIVQMPFILDHLGEYRPRPITRALSTIVADGNHQSIICPPFITELHGGGSKAREVTEPLATVCAGGQLVYPSRSVSIKIEDCTFRMMLPYPEISRAMAFDDGYKVLGTRREQVRQYGNATTKPVIRWIIERCMESLD